MRIAMTPSLNASILPLVMPSSLLRVAAS
jgi:hypothetical protein